MLPREQHFLDKHAIEHTRPWLHDVLGRFWEQEKQDHPETEVGEGSGIRLGAYPISKMEDNNDICRTGFLMWLHKLTPWEVVSLWSASIG